MSRIKIEYLECKSSNAFHEADVEVMLETQVISKKASSKYLGSIIKGDWET